MGQSNRKPRVLPSSPFQQPSVVEELPETYEVSERVSHDRFGLGSVITIEADGRSVVVNFGTVARRINLPCQKMVKL